MSAQVEIIRVAANEKNPIAQLALAFWKKGEGESTIELRGPTAQHATLFVRADDKARFIAELRAALAEWEKAQ